MRARRRGRGASWLFVQEVSVAVSVVMRPLLLSTAFGGPAPPLRGGDSSRRAASLSVAFRASRPSPAEGARAAVLNRSSPDRHLGPRPDQHDLAVAVGDAERQDLGHRRADLARREVDDGEDEAAGEVFEAVVPGDLGRGFLDADRRAEIDRQTIGGLSRLREGLGRDDAADTDARP